MPGQRGCLAIQYTIRAVRIAGSTWGRLRGADDADDEAGTGAGTHHTPARARWPGVRSPARPFPRND